MCVDFMLTLKYAWQMGIKITFITCETAMHFLIMFVKWLNTLYWQFVTIVSLGELVAYLN